MAGQAEGGGEVGIILGGDQVEGDSDLVQRGGIPAGDVEHPLVPGGVGGAGRQPGGVAGGGQHLEVAGQQVFRGTAGPPPVPVFLRPGVQAVLVAGQPLIAEVCPGGGLEFLMAQQVHLGAVLGLPRAHPPGEGAPGHPVQDVLDLPEGFAGQGGQVGAAEPAPGGGEQPEQILLGGRAAQQAAEFLLRQRPDVLGVGGGGQRADDAGLTQPVPAGYIVGDRRVRPSGHHDPHPGRRVMRQQRGDAARVRPGGDAAVLIQPVHHQDQPLTLRGAGLGGLLQHPEQVGVPGASRQHRGQVLSQQLGQLLQHDLGESLPGVLGAQPGGDEERHHPHPGWRVQHERRHQRRLPRPRRRLPPHIRATARLGAVRRQLPQLRLAADQLRRRDPFHLLAVRRPHRRPPRP